MLLLPASVDDYVAADDPARLIAAFVDDLTCLSGIGESERVSRQLDCQATPSRTLLPFPANSPTAGFGGTRRSVLDRLAIEQPLWHHAGGRLLLSHHGEIAIQQFPLDERCVETMEEIPSDAFSRDACNLQK
jgi:hypothetical protein